MVAKAKRNGGNTHDKRHENGLAAPGKRIHKQKSNPQLGPAANGRSQHKDPTPPPLPGHTQGLQMTQQPMTLPDDDPEHAPPHHQASGSSMPATGTSSGSGLDARAHGQQSTEGQDPYGAAGQHQRPHHQAGGAGGFDMTASAPRVPASQGPAYMLTVATTILSSCPLRDVLAILIILLQLPPTVLTVVQFLFATLTFVPPQAGTPLSALSAFPSFTDIFQGSGGTPSLFTIVFADAIILVAWLAFAVPLQNLVLDLAQAVIAIALGGAAAGHNSNANGIIICVIIIAFNHLFRYGPLRHHIVHFLWAGLARGGLDFMTSPPSMPSYSKPFATPHGWPRSLLGIHILAQGVVRMIRRSLSRRDASQARPAGKKVDPEAGVLSARAPSINVESSADGPPSSSTDGRPPGPSPAAQSSKEKISSSRKKRKQATHVRSQQPFWAALASTKVTVLKEMESSRAANDAGEANAKDAHHIGNAIWAGEDDRVWISEVGHTNIVFRVRMGSCPSSDVREGSTRASGSGIDKSKPFYLRVNGADWSSTRIHEEGTGFWVGDVFGLTALSNYFCEFVRTADDEVFYSASLITSTGPLDEQSKLHALLVYGHGLMTAAVASPPPHPTLRPSSPTTTLKNSIAAADQKLQEQRNRRQRHRKEHKAAITAIKKEVEALNNRLANAGGSDERQRQRALQFNQNIRQADDAAAEFASQIESLGEIPQEELDDAAAKKKAWKKERQHKEAVTAELEKTKAELERQAERVKSDINSVLQKRERLNHRQAQLNERHDRLVIANREGFSLKQRKEQERAAVRLERQNIETNYRTNIANFEYRTNECNVMVGQMMQSLQHYETLLQQAQQQHQRESVPTTPEGPLPGTTNFTPQPVPFSTFAFPSLTAHIHSTPGSIRGGRGRSSSMLSNVSGFTDGFEDATASPSAMVAPPNPFDYSYYPGSIANGKKGISGNSSGSGNGSVSLSLSSGTSSQSSSQRDPLSPVPNKMTLNGPGPGVIGSGSGNGSGSGGKGTPVGFNAAPGAGR